MFHSNKTRRNRNSRNQRRGNILVLSAVMMVMVMAFVAFALDLGSVCVARGELQRCADSAAMAAAWDLINNDPALTGSSNYTTLKNNSRAKATQYALWNKVLSASPAVPNADVEVGVMTDPTAENATINTTSTYVPNAVRVTVRRTSGTNGAINFAFGRVLGKFSQEAEAQATAAMITNFGGFRTPADGSNLELLPIALDDESLQNLLDGNGPDGHSWDPVTKTVSEGSDGIRELNLYPQGGLTAGNRGTVDIGSAANSTEVIADQVVNGISAEDLAYHGGELKFDANGKLNLNGDTGISAGIADELASIIGKPRFIPVFTQVISPGNNANFTITKFVGIRIMEVKLTGANSAKKVMIQPCNIMAKGGIPAAATETSYFMYSPVWLVK